MPNMRRSPRHALVRSFSLSPLISLAHLHSNSLSPCGHIFCLSCLQTWFRQAPTGEDAAIADTDFIHRVKKCPCCRSEIATRPTPVFLVKSVCKALADAKNPNPRPPPSQAPPEDVWDGLFHRPGVVCTYFLDTEDDGEDGHDEDDDEDEDEYGDSDDSMGEYDVPDDFEYGSDGEDEFMGEWVSPTWEPPSVEVTSDMEDLYEAEEISMLRRGATSEMIDQFGMTYTHSRGLLTYVAAEEEGEPDMMIWLGWNVVLKEEDVDGVEFMEWARMDMDEVRTFSLSFHR